MGEKQPLPCRFQSHSSQQLCIGKTPSFCIPGSCPGFHTTPPETKEPMPSPKSAEAGTRNEVSLMVQLEGVREKSSSSVTSATGTSLLHFLEKEIHIPNNQNEWEHHCSALSQCKWAAGFSPVLGWGIWAAERTGGEMKNDLTIWLFSL